MNQLQSRTDYQDEAARWQLMFDGWLDGGAPAACRDVVNRVVVVDECVSTQDVCMELMNGTGRAGGCCVSVHQTGGRGRLGRKWIDARGECASFTLAMEFDGCAERLAIRCGLATCIAAEKMIVETGDGGSGSGGRGGGMIRWPNDVMVNERKLAGVLIEVRDAIAFTGIGMNVAQREWPVELRDRAISLYEINEKCNLSRPVVIMRILEALGEVIAWDDKRIVEEFKSRDCLAGTMHSFETGGKRVYGEVISLDPLRGLVVRVEDADCGFAVDENGCVFLPASNTSLVKD